MTLQFRFAAGSALAALLLVSTIHSSTAQIPATISYQGVLHDVSGVVVPDGDYALEFSLYPQLENGTALWTEAQTLAVTGGVFSAVLGSVESLAALPFDAPYYLGVKVGTDDELSPRIALTASPYSLNSRGSTGGGAFDGESLGIGVQDPNAYLPFNTSILTLASKPGLEDVVHRYASESVAGRVPSYIFATSGGTHEAPEILPDGQVVGFISSYGFDGSDFLRTSIIAFSTQGTPAAGSIPGVITFNTRSATSGDALLRMILDSEGRLGIGTSAPTERLQLGDFDAGEHYLAIKSVGGNQVRNGIKFRNFSEEYGWTIANDERFDIGDGLHFNSHFAEPDGVTRLFLGKFGGVGIGTTTPSAALDVEGDVVAANVSVEQDGQARGGFFLASPGDFNHALYNNLSDIDGEGSFDGAKWNVFDGLHIRVGADEGRRAALIVTGSGRVGIVGDNSTDILANGVPGIDLAIDDTDTGIDVSGDGILSIYTNNVERMVIKSDGNIGIGADPGANPLYLASGAHVTAGGVWTDASSRALKENVSELSLEAALSALHELSPVTFNYRAQQGESYVGFIAEDVPELVAHNDRASLSSMDIVAVLTRVVQEQQRTIARLQADVNALMLSAVEK